MAAAPATNSSCVGPDAASRREAASNATTSRKPYANESCLAASESSEPRAKLEVLRVEGQALDEAAGPEEDEQVDSNEAQENVRMSVLAEPETRANYSSSAGAVDNEWPVSSQAAPEDAPMGLEGEEEEEEEMERRLFGLGSLTDEMRKQLRKQRFKLFSRAHLKKRKRKRGPGARPRPALTRQSAASTTSTSTANYGDLSPADTWLQEMSPGGQTMSAGLMHKLMALDKLSSATGGQPRLLPDAHLLDTWAAGDPTGARQALVKHAQSKMIPIEIIGLDPQVTKSILAADSTAPHGPSPEEAMGSFASDSTLVGNQHLRLLRAPPPPPLPKTSQILHVHHFHTGRPLLGQTTLPVSLMEPLTAATGGAHRQSAASKAAALLHLATDSSRQAFLNERGELVYFDPNADLSGLGPPEVVPALDLNTVSAADSSRDKQVAGAMVQYVPAGSHLSQHRAPLGSAEKHSGADDKLLMVAYRPQQQQQQPQQVVAASVPPLAANHSLLPADHAPEALVNRYNEGQESKSSMGGLVLRPLSGLLQSVVGGGGQANKLPVGEQLPFAAADLLGGPNRAKPSASRAPLSHAHLHLQEPELLIKGPPPVDSQSFWLGAPPAGLEPAARNLTSQRQVLHGAGSRPLMTNGTLPGASQDFLRKLLKGLQLQKDTGSQNNTSVGLLAPGSASMIKATKQQQQLQTGASTGKLGGEQPALRVRNQPPGEPAMREFVAVDPTEGLGNITLAFISVVSLLTLILIAASMLYRHRRRSSVSRCDSLPARSRLNLTHRTKRFMRSNFVRADQGITPIKRVDLDSNCSSPAAAAPPPPPPGAPAPGKLSALPSGSQLESQQQQRQLLTGKPAPSGADRYQASKATGVPAQLLSTFNGAPPVSQQPADIKTLNTRLQKSSAYLKSLISGPPECAAGCTSGAASNKHQQADAVCSNQCRQHTSQELPAAPSSGKRSHSFKQQASCVESSQHHNNNNNHHNHHHHHHHQGNNSNYSFARKPGSAGDRSSVDSKRFQLLNRMSTINSESDSNLHSCKFSDSEGSQHQLQVSAPQGAANISCRANELNNLMNPRHHHHHLSTADKYLVERRL